ncbi:M16 family metallopeptidase [Arsenicicoccus sp. oral taxon 190]|uniref:M16 family metallopeptidase n=1 Tax=Arsenicicoccus sp. oral taxon 190 TaxID=1658671 RepID=UPI00067A2B57|nr:pitrilysin family protein [Arsenicicoccus sp. oral taxon 190]AKT51409.1 peptidase M16 [Arsenicicoccus sp. oral taxon 190]
MPLNYQIEERTLANGLRVIVNEDHSVPTVTVNLWVGVGSRHETPGRTGFAHLFEHLMFQGSANVPSGDHFAVLMAHGARLNATTWFDRTNYFETVPRGAFELALWLEADRHGRLLAAVTQENLDNQRDVVKEEKRQRYDNQPYGFALADLYASLFPEGHPYHHPTIGSMEDLDAASLQDVHEFFQRYYGPNNTTLTLVGDLTPEEGFAAAERYFGELPASAAAGRESVAPLPPLSEPVRFERRDDVPSDRLFVGFRLPVDDTDEFYAASAALDVLAGLSTSRVYTRLVRREHLANSVHGVSWGLVDGVSVGFISIDVAEGVDPGVAEAALCEELERLGEAGPTPLELESVQAQSERAWLSALASADERADTICGHAALHGDSAFINTFLDRIATITAEQVQEAARTYLQPRNRAVVAHLRDESAAPGTETATPSEADGEQEPGDLDDRAAHDEGTTA